MIKEINAPKLGKGGVKLGKPLVVDFWPSAIAQKIWEVSKVKIKQHISE